MYQCVCVRVCSMDGFRVVKLEDVLPLLDILITATGQSVSIQSQPLVNSSGSECTIGK